MWNEIPIPEPPSEIRAYTHANESVLFVCTTRGVFALSLNAQPTWDFIAERVAEHMLYNHELVQYDDYGGIIFREAYSPIHGYPTEDSEGCSDIPVSENPLSGDRLDYDQASDTLYVIDISDPRQVKLVVERFGASDDNWATAGFSNDGNYLTVGNLERILVFKYSPDAADRA